MISINLKEKQSRVYFALSRVTHRDQKRKTDQKQYAKNAANEKHKTFTPIT